MNDQPEHDDHPCTMCDVVKPTAYALRDHVLNVHPEQFAAWRDHSNQPTEHEPVGVMAAAEFGVPPQCSCGALTWCNLTTQQQTAEQPAAPAVGDRYIKRADPDAGRTVTVNNVWTANYGHTAVAYEWHDPRASYAGSACPLDVFHAEYQPAEQPDAPAADGDRETRELLAEQTEAAFRHQAERVNALRYGIEHALDYMQGRACNDPQLRYILRGTLDEDSNDALTDEPAEAHPVETEWVIEVYLSAFHKWYPLARTDSLAEANAHRASLIASLDAEQVRIARRAIRTTVEPTGTPTEQLIEAHVEPCAHGREYGQPCNDCRDTVAATAEEA